MFGIDFSQASTWKGLISLLAGLGLFTLTSVQTELIVAVCIAVYNLLSVILKDKFTKKEA
jgi:hypothetical protein